MSKEHNISVICPAYNEQENLPILLGMFDDLFRKIKRKYKVIIINDCSTDKTQRVLEYLKEKYDFLKIGKTDYRSGKTGCINKGKDIATGDITVIFDSDLQYHPKDIPKLIGPIENNDFDVISGWRQGKYSKQFISKLYNLMLRLFFKIKLHDSSAALAIRSDILKEMNLHKDWHRYIIPLALQKGCKIGEEKISLYPRKHGASNYKGISRILGVFDLLSVKFLTVFGEKPMTIFGTMGIILFIFGLIWTLVYLLRVYFSSNIVYLSKDSIIFLFLVGIILFMMGFVAEMIVDLKYEIKRSKEK